MTWVGWTGAAVLILGGAGWFRGLLRMELEDMIYGTGFALVGGALLFADLVL